MPQLICVGILLLSYFSLNCAEVSFHHGQPPLQLDHTTEVVSEIIGVRKNASLVLDPSLTNQIKAMRD